MTKQKQYSWLVAFIYIMNNNVSGGLLAMPFVFYHAGLLVALILLLLVAMSTIPPLIWTLEVMARAQALEDRHSGMDLYGGDGEWSCESETDTEPFHGSLTPQFRISIDRKFEVDELCKLFLSPWIGYLFGLSVVIWCELAMWHYVTLAASAWSAHIPINLDGFEQCSDDDFRMRMHPTGPCWNTYTLCVAMFGLIVVPISLMDLTEQKFLQTFLGGVRVVAIILMVGYCLVGLLTENIVPEDSETSDIGEVWLDSDLIGAMAVIPVVAHALSCQPLIPSFVQPVTDKRKLHVVMVAAILSCAFVYAIVGVTISLHFQSQVVETSSLCWVPFTEPGNKLSLRILSSFIVLHVSVVMVSAMPLSAVACANYIMSLGKDYFGPHPSKFSRIVIRFCTATIPLIGAIVVSNLVDVLKYGGLAGYCSIYVIPALLVITSRRKCQKVFAPRKGQGLARSYSWKSENRDSPESLVSWDYREDRRSQLDFPATPYTGILSSSVVVSLVLIFSCIAVLTTVISVVVSPY